VGRASGLRRLFGGTCKIRRTQNKSEKSVCNGLDEPLEYC